MIRQWNFPHETGILFKNQRSAAIYLRSQIHHHHHLPTTTTCVFVLLGQQIHSKLINNLNPQFKSFPTPRREV